MLKGFAAAACLCVAALAAAERSPLSGQQISDLVAGATVEIDAPLGFKVRLRYTRDGRVFGETSTALVLMLGAASDTGRWWIEPDQICHKWKIWFNDYPQCFRMTKEGQTFHWRTFDDKTGTAAIIVPAPPLRSAGATQPSMPETGVTRPPQPESAKPTASTQAPRPLPKPVARPETTKQAAEQSAQEKVPAARTASAQAASSQAPSSQAPSSQAPSSPTGGMSRARMPSAPTSAFMVVKVAPGDVLNVRKGPSTDFEVVGGLPPGSRGVTVTGACQSRWCPVEHPSARGWVNSTYLAREEPPGAGTDTPAGRTGRAGTTTGK
jgi:Bacterial SH3 domain